MRKNAAACPTRATFAWGRPERENRTPANIAKRRYCDNGEGVVSRPLPYPLGKASVSERDAALGAPQFLCTLEDSSSVQENK